MGMKDKKLAREIAEQRMVMIAPLLSLPLLSESYYDKRREISEECEVSARTLQR
jgi:hypothetical protein